MSELRAVGAHEVEWSIDCLDEETPVRGNALASGDEAVDRECEDRILRELDEGNPWAWCCVRVRCTWRGFRGEDYLGACSYSGKAQFKEPGGYFEDMRARALADLNESIRVANESIATLNVHYQSEAYAKRGEE
jgi:hypothetical protein